MARSRSLYQKPRKPRRPVAPAPPPTIVPVPDPLRLAVRCPACRSEAIWFAPSSWAGINKRVDAAAKGRAIVEPGRVVQFPSLIEPGEDEIHWRVYRHRGGTFTGLFRCDSCKVIEPRPINWPRDAYFQVTVKRSTLFAANHADWGAFRAYIAASNRRELYRAGKAHWACRYLPRGIIAAKNRTAVLRAIDAFLR